MRQPLGGTDEVSRRIVDEHVNAPEVLHDRIQHGRYLFRMAYITGHWEDGVSACSGHLVCCGFQDFLTTAGDGDLCAKTQKSFTHGPAEAGSAAGDEHDFVFEEIGLKHAGDTPSFGIDENVVLSYHVMTF
ncbi:hypothetical protein GCM10025857_25900 [Alicyclobacillus contaminans]|nr:hypothetical protein GCM10025857_25900 [Alicyclobacillus contaminans]